MAKPWREPGETIPPGDAVYTQMAGDFPETALGWVRHAGWEGPWLVPTARLDFTDAGTWRAAREPKKVKRFARRIQGKMGKPVKPVVLLHIPGRRHLVIIDGHHRSLAARQLGTPVNAWIGTLHTPAQAGEAEETQNTQKTGVEVAGLAVHAADTGRLLLLQRAIDDEDPASGCWEFPGGHLEPGEKPLDAARREWAEETGITVPGGIITGQWATGVYTGFVLTIPAEQAIPLHDRDDATNPDDPDGLYTEDLAWWHPSQLPEAMLRPELAAALPRVLAALGPVTKQGSVLDYQMRQTAAEHARDLTTGLAASVNAGMLAHAWLARHPQRHHHRRQRHPRRQGQQQKPQPQQRPAPRAFLSSFGVTQALTAILARVLADVWAVAWTIAIATAVMLLGLAVTPDDTSALARLEHDGDQRLEWILQTRLSRLERVLLQALRENWTASQLAGAIRDILESLTAALLVTGTETQWAAEHATMWAYQQAGVTCTTWQTMRDGRVCTRCRTAQAAGPWPLGKPFPGTSVPAPPAHPRCVIGSTRISARSVVPADVLDGSARLVVAASAGQTTAPTTAAAGRDFGRGNIRAVTYRDYVGDVITIRTALGYELTTTPNHPVATRAGWIPVTELAVGDHVLSSISGEWRPPGVDPDVDDIPPRIEDVTQAFPVDLGPVPVAAEDFHGDGAGSEICVIRADGLLVDDLPATPAEHAGEHEFGGRNIAGIDALALNTKGPGQQKLLALGDAAYCRVSGRSQSGAFFGAGLAHPAGHGLTAAPGRYSTADEAFADGAPADTEGFCERLLALSPEITLDQIVDVKRNVVAAHVYNLDTADGYYISNGILTHNCRCHLQPAKPPQPAKKSAETAELEATPHILGPHGLWHTPGRHVDFKQKLPNYIEHVAAALMRDQGLDESAAIATAINAVKRWAKGDLHWGKGHVTPEVQRASQRALDEWEDLKASHK